MRLRAVRRMPNSTCARACGWPTLYPPEALAETVRHRPALCTFSLDELRYEYPDELVPPGQTPAGYLRQET